MMRIESSENNAFTRSASDSTLAISSPTCLRLNQSTGRVSRWRKTPALNLVMIFTPSLESSTICR